MTKKDIIEAMEKLPDEATWEDAIDRLYVLYLIEAGLAEAEAAQKIPQEEVRDRIRKWLR